MELAAEQGGLLEEYVKRFEPLIGDKRTRLTFKETVRGIISAGSLVCQRVAAHSAVLSAVKDGGQRVIRLATGESTRRSRLDAESLTAVLRDHGIRRFSETQGDELWLMIDSSDLRKPYAREMPSLMQVRDLDGNLVPGYRTLNVLGVTPQRRGILFAGPLSVTGRLLRSNPDSPAGIAPVGVAVRIRGLCVIGVVVIGMVTASSIQ